jgi:hypothetical protein
MIATKPVDVRNGAERLAALVSESIGADPFSGAVYLFREKGATGRACLLRWGGRLQASSSEEEGDRHDVDDVDEEGRDQR